LTSFTLHNNIISCYIFKEGRDRFVITYVISTLLKNGLLTSFTLNNNTISCYIFKEGRDKFVRTGQFGCGPKDLLSSYLLKKDLFYFLRVFGYFFFSFYKSKSSQQIFLLSSDFQLLKSLFRESDPKIRLGQ